MYYYKWPETGVGSYSYQWRDTTLNANFGETQYKYDSMVSKYNDKTIETEEVADALATLNYHCGVSVNMIYSSRGSSSVFSRTAMENYFRYKQVLYTEGKNPEDLDAVYEELSHHRPLLAATSNPNHGFILDGYEKGGYVHFNLGSNFVNCYVSWYDKSGWYDWVGEDLQDSIGWWNLRESYCFIPDKDAKEIEKDGIKYLIYNEKALVVGGKPSGDLCIPSTIEGEGNKEVKVSCILDDAFRNASELTSISIPQSVYSIGRLAFSWSGLKSITIPNSVVSIGNNVFMGCNNLTDITLSESLQRIPWSAFQGDKKLISIIIPNSVKNIGAQAFISCKQLSFVVMPDSLLSIGRSAFSYCEKLSSLRLPKSLMHIDDSAFTGTGLRDLYCERKAPSEYNCSEEAFWLSFDYSKCTLHVPIGCKEAYASLSPWSNFTNIVEDVLSVESVEEDKVTSEKYYSIDGRAMDGTPTNKEIFVRNGKKFIVK